jgi:hypothetical protein
MGTVVNPPFQNRLEGNLTGFEKFEGKVDGFIDRG